MLVEIGIADAYGCGFEFVSPEKRIHKKLVNDLSRYYPHNLAGNLPAGFYSDDTQMSIAVAEAMLFQNNNKVEWDEKLLAAFFVSTYKRDPRNSYSRNMHNLLEKARTGKQFRKLCIPNSDGCGSVMRSCPIGLLSDPIKVWEYAAVQARVTHNTLDGILYSVIVALAVHHQYYRLGPVVDMVKWIGDFIQNERILNFQKYQASSTLINNKASDVALKALELTSQPNKVSDLLKECNSYTGDVDSLSAVTLGIASVSDCWINDLPENLYNDLENGNYGLDYLKALNQKLFETFPR